MLDLEIGTCAIGEDPLAEELLATLLSMQGEGGYASEEGSARFAELLAWARILADGAIALEAVASNISPALAEEMLDAWERSMRVPNDAARTREERQQRLVALRAMTGRTSIAEIERIAALAGVPVDMRASKRAIADQAAGEIETVFQGGALLASELWTNRGRTTLALLLRRMLPAWRFGQHRRHRPDALLATTVGGAWSSTAQTVGRTLLLSTTPGAAYALRPVARVASYGHLSRLDAADLNRIQDNVFCAPLAGADNDALAADLKEGGVYFFSLAVPGSSTVVVASGLDFRNRYVKVSAWWSASDIRPGQASDGTMSGSPDGILWATRTGVSSRAIGSSQVTLGASATQISATNANVATRYLIGCLFVTPQVTSGTRSSRLVDFVDETSTFASVSPNLPQSLIDVGSPRAANGAGADAWTGFPTTSRGAVHRLVCLPTTTRPASLSTTYVLDTSIDWRDRLVCIHPIIGGTINADPVFPGVSGDSQYQLLGTSPPVPWYTGTGITTALAALQPYEIDATVRVGVRALDGALIAQHHTGSSAANGLVLLSLIASDPLSKRSVASPIATLPTPSGGSNVEPFQLNAVQDGALYAQAMERDDGAAPIVAMPLGPRTRGHTRTPVAWTERRRSGRVGETRRPRRQPVAGRLRRYAAFDIATGTTLTLDATQDWRDRVISASYAIDAADIRPGGGSETNINSSSTQAHTSVYSGPGGDTYRLNISGAFPNSVRLRVNATTGALEARNDLGATRYVVMMIEASFQLGPRSA